MNFIETEVAKELLTNLLSEHLKYVKADLTSTDVDVLNQKSRFYKWGCFAIYGHLYKKGICCRCGYAKREKQ